MAKNKLVAPVVKWVGGKRQLLDEITPLLPKRITSYCEPFLGGGAVLFSIQPTRAIVNDLNQDLITMLKVCWNPLRSTKILLNTFTLSEIWTEIKKYIKLCRKLKGLRD